jgi:Tat protein translocase TatB subunit
MLNVGPLELLVVLAVALIVVGPERLPELARSVGRVLRQFREVQDEVRDLVSSGVDDEMRTAADEFRKATGSVKRATDVKGAVRRAQRSIREETAVHRTGSPRPAGGGPEGPVEAEAAGPPADRLVEDGVAGRSAGPPDEDAAPHGPAAPDPSEPEGRPDR